MRDEGGQAFPGKVCVVHTGIDQTPVYEHPYGMTLRDYFAAAALQGMLCNGFTPDEAYVSTERKNRYTVAAYKLADHMLAERVK